MSIHVSDTIVPGGSTFGIIHDYDQIGGYAAMADETAIGALASGKLVVNGTWRKSIASGTTYLYTSNTPAGGFANGTWTPVAVSSSSGTWSPGADCAATSNITLSGSQTIDGVSVTTGKRVLVVGQTSASANGIYTANSAGAWSRASDANTAGAFVVGKQISVVGGTVSAGAIYVLSVAPTILGTDAIQFVVNSQGAVVNWASPGAIGSTTPNTGAFTQLTLTGPILWGTATSSGKGAILTPIATVTTNATIAVGTDVPFDGPGLALTVPTTTTLGDTFAVGEVPQTLTGTPPFGPTYQSTTTACTLSNPGGQSYPFESPENGSLNSSLQWTSDNTATGYVQPGRRIVLQLTANGAGTKFWRVIR